MKKSIFFVFALLLAFSLAGSATATKPAPTYCVLFWLDSNYDFGFIPVEGKMAYNETAQLYNASCRYKFDFASGEWQDVATLCSIFSAYCNPSQTMFTFIGWGWESEYGYTEDTIYQVHQNGQARYFAQLAQKQCDNFYMSYSYTYLPMEEWTPGTHSYYFIENGPDGTVVHDPIEFTVDENAPLYDTNLRLGLLGISSADGRIDYPYMLNPEQETYMQFTWLSNLVEELRIMREAFSNQLVIDGGDPIPLTPGPVVNSCSNSSDGAYVRAWGFAR